MGGGFLRVSFEFGGGSRSRGIDAGGSRISGFCSAAELSHNPFCFTVAGRLSQQFTDFLIRRLIELLVPLSDSEKACRCDSAIHIIRFLSQLIACLRW